MQILLFKFFHPNEQLDYVIYGPIFCLNVSINSTWKQGIQTSTFHNFFCKLKPCQTPQYSNWIPQASATFKSYTLELSFNLVFQEPKLQFWSIMQNNNTLFHQKIEVQKHIHKIKKKLFKEQPNFQNPEFHFHLSHLNTHNPENSMI